MRATRPLEDLCPGMLRRDVARLSRLDSSALEDAYRKQVAADWAAEKERLARGASRGTEPVRARRGGFGPTVVAFAIALACALLALSGCSSPITHEQLVTLDRAIRNERRATMARPGFEIEVADLRSATNAYLGAALEATRR